MNVGSLLWHDVIVVGALYGNWVACSTGEPRCFLAGIAVEFKQITARQELAFCIVRHHLCDVDTVRIDRYLVAQLITTFVFAIDDDIDWLAPRHVVVAHSACYLKRYEVTHQGFIVVIVDECPLLGFRRRAHVGVLEHATRCVELDAIRFLGVCQRAIAAETSRASFFLNLRLVIINDCEGRDDFVHFVVWVDVIDGVKGQGGQVRELIEMRVVSFFSTAIESNFRYVAPCIVWADVADITEASRDINIGIAHCADSAFLVD